MHASRRRICGKYRQFSGNSSHGCASSSDRLPDLTGWVIVRLNDVPVEGLCRGRRVPNLNRLAERSMFHNGDEQTEERAPVK